MSSALVFSSIVVSFLVVGFIINRLYRFILVPYRPLRLVFRIASRQTPSRMACPVKAVGDTFHRPIAQGCATAVHRLDGRILSDPHRSPSPWVWGSPGRNSGVGLEATAFEVSSLDDSDPVHGSDGCAG